jgi:hypothetical protein
MCIVIDCYSKFAFGGYLLYFAATLVCRHHHLTSVKFGCQLCQQTQAFFQFQLYTGVSLLAGIQHYFGRLSTQ